MKYKISNVYLTVNGEDIAVGVVLGEEDKPKSPFRTEYIRASEYEKGLKEFKYGKQQMGDMVYHCVGKFVDFKALWHVDEKWIEELKLMRYDTSKLINRMNIKEFAKSISGKEYGYPQFTKEEIKTAKENEIEPNIKSNDFVDRSVLK